MVIGFCPSPHCHLSMNLVWFKCQQQLFDGQGTGRTDRWTKLRLYASPFGEHKNGYGEITLSIYKIWLYFLCTALSLTAIYLQTKFNINHFCSLWPRPDIFWLTSSIAWGHWPAIHEFITQTAELWYRWIRLSCYYFILI